MPSGSQQKALRYDQLTEKLHIYGLKPYTDSENLPILRLGYTKDAPVLRAKCCYMKTEIF